MPSTVALRAPVRGPAASTLAVSAPRSRAASIPRGLRPLRASPSDEQAAPGVSTSVKEGEASAAGPPPPSPSSSSVDPLAPKGKRKADSTDPIATFLTRRFGLAGGFAWLGFLAVGSLGEQVKTRIEYANENGNTKDVVDAKVVSLPSGVTIKDTRVGGGSTPYKGALMAVHYKGMLPDGTVFEDTFARGKPIVYLFGTRPFGGGMNAGLEEAISTMKVNGRRIAQVPSSLAFGESGAMLRPTEHVPDKRGLVPPNSDLTYEVELVRVSIPPS